MAAHSTPEQSRAWYLKNKDRRRAQYLANREERLAYAKRQRIKKAAENKAWRDANREHLRAYNDRYRRADLGRDAHRKALRRARAAAAPGSHTREEWVAKCAEYKYRCAYCHRRRPLERDHVVALVRGGPHYISNIVPACRSCNARKHARELAEFLAA